MKHDTRHGRDRMTDLVLFALLAAMVLVAARLPAQSGPTADEIIRRLERNNTHDTSRAAARMIISDRFGRRESEMIILSRGTNDVLIEFTSAAERGQKVLRTEDEIYLFYPDAAELVRLQGAALRESMLGSDVSYEDLTGGRSILDDYRATLHGLESVGERDAWRVELEARVRDIAYPRQMVWVDSERYTTLRSELYALNGRLLKTLEFDRIERHDNSWVAMRTVVSDALKRNSSTEVLIDSLELGIRLSPRTFSLEELTW